MAVTSIEWTYWTMPDGTQLQGMVWNPCTGCDQVSPGCAHCYAKGIAKRFWASQYPPVLSEGCTIKTRPREFEDVQIHPDRLQEPLSWQAPRGIFVNSMSDLFHDDIPDSFIAAVLGVIWATRRHMYFILTKRIERVPKFLDRLELNAQMNGFKGRLGEYCCFIASRLYGIDVREENVPTDDVWPPPNVRIGPSIENQPFADKRFPVVCELGEAGWNTMVSLEPLLGPVHIPDRYLALGRRAWAVVGGESGGKARSLFLEWVRAIVARCTAYGVAVFVKQLGARPRRETGRFQSFTTWVNKGASWLRGGGRCIDAKGRHLHIGRDFMRARDENTFPVTFHHPLKLKDRKGANPAEWPEDLQVQQIPVERAA